MNNLQRKAIRFSFIMTIFLLLVSLNNHAIANEYIESELKPKLPYDPVDSYGISLLSGQANITGLNVSIGTGESGIFKAFTQWNKNASGYSGLVHRYSTMQEGCHHPTSTTQFLDPEGFYIKISNESGSVKFKQTDTSTSNYEGPFERLEGKGSLVMSDANTFLYTSSSGGKYYYDIQNTGLYQQVGQADKWQRCEYKPEPVAALSKIVKPDGEIIELTTKQFNFNEGFHDRNSISSSLGWIVHSNTSYDTGSSYSSTLISYSATTKFVAINQSVKHCSISSLSTECDDSINNWQTSSYLHDYERVGEKRGRHTVDYSGSVTNTLGDKKSLSFDYSFPTTTYDISVTEESGVNKIYTYKLCYDSDISNRGELDWYYCTNTQNLGKNRIAKVKIGNNEFSYLFYNPYANLYYNLSGIDPPFLSVTAPEDKILAAGSNYIPTKSEDKLGRITDIDWENGQIEKITNNDDFITEYDFDLRGNVKARYRYPESTGTPLTLTATYQDSGLSTCSNPKTCNKPLTITDEKGVTTTYTYYPEHGGVKTITKPADNGMQAQTRYYYAQKTALIKNSSGALVASTPVWRLTSTSACRTGTLNSCVGTADELVTTIEYDVDITVSGNETKNVLPVRKTVSLGDGSISQVTTTAYDIYGNIKSIDGPKPGSYDKVFYFYDLQRQKIAEIGVDPDGSGSKPRQATRTYYNGDGQVKKVNQGIVTSTTLAAVNAMHIDLQKVTEYNNMGLVEIERTYAKGVQRAVTQKSYNNKLQLECVAQRLNPDFFNNLPESACSLGVKGEDGNDRITQYEYDLTGELLTTTSALGTDNERVDRSNIYRADNGLLEQTADGLNNNTFYKYDDYNRLYKTVYPNKTNGSVESSSDYTQTTYSGAQISKIRLRDGQIINYSDYDNSGRLAGKTGAVIESFIHDNFNNVITHSNTTSGYQSGMSTSIFDFNALGWKESEKTGTETTAYRYNDYGQRTRLTWPDNFYVTYDYTVNGYPSDQLQKIKQYQSTNLASFTYDNYGRRKSLTRGNGVVTDYLYDDMLRLESLSTDLNGSTYDISETFKYTHAGQLKTRTFDTLSSDYIYQQETASINYGIPNALNQITSENGDTIKYDDRGNLRLEYQKGYSYNANNLMLHVGGPWGTTQLTYDSENRLSRITKNGSIKSYFRYDGQDLITEKNSAGTITARYVHGPNVDDPIVWYVGSGTTTKRYFSENYQGSIVNISDSSGNTYAVNNYDDYGIPDDKNVGRFGYTGQIWLGANEGVYYYKARIYHPKLGRFLQTDPIGYKDGMNWYAYVGNDPVNMADSEGMSKEPSLIRYYSTFQDFNNYFSFSKGAQQVLRKYGATVVPSAQPSPLSTAQKIGAVAGIIPGWGALAVNVMANIADMIDTGSGSALAGTSASQFVNRAGTNAKGWKSILMVESISKFASAIVSNEVKDFESAQVKTQPKKSQSKNSDSSMPEVVVIICTGAGATGGDKCR